VCPTFYDAYWTLSGIIFNITGGSDLTLNEVNRVSQVVTSLADPAANIIFGAVVDPR
jgi:cell division protein FtsZ